MPEQNPTRKEMVYYVLQLTSGENLYNTTSSPNTLVDKKWRKR
jgi:hypothetical protein